MSSDLKLEDFFPWYPDVDDPDLQYKIGSKKEFYDLKLDRHEAPPTKRREFFNHQLIIQRYLRAYDDLLIFHDPGTCKTSAVVSLTEYYKNNSESIKKVY